MEQIINWKLKSNNKVVYNYKNVICDYVPDKYLIFKENAEINKIDLVSKIYERVTEEHKMIIDFNEKVGTFIFDNDEKYSFDIDASFHINYRNIKLKYSLGEEEKIITIGLKEKDNENTIN